MVDRTGGVFVRRLFISKERTRSPTLRPSRGEAGRRTSQCHPPSPTDFLTTPVSPMRELFVRLFPVTRTWGGGGRVRSGGGEMIDDLDRETTVSEIRPTAEGFGALRASFWWTHLAGGARVVDREVDAGGCAARRDASFFDTTRSTRKDRADGASRRASRARAKKRAGRKGTKKDRLARRGKRRRPRLLRTGGLPRVPRGGASRAPSCVSATGRIPHPRIVRLPHPRRSSSRVRLDAEEQTAGGITWDCRMHPREEEE